MTLDRITQTLVLGRYSRILVPLPPVQSIKDEVGKLVEDEFKVTPEYVETDWCEGYAISWRSWYGFDEFEEREELYSVFRILARRGYWNCSNFIVNTRRNQFYEKIGFNFALPF